MSKEGKGNVGGKEGMIEREGKGEGEGEGERESENL